MIKQGLGRRIDQLRTGLAARDENVLARNCGAELIDGCLHMEVWETAVFVDLNNFIAYEVETGDLLDPLLQTVIAYYLSLADGTLPAHRWISFSGLANGNFYTKAFQGYSGKVLADVFGNDVARFARTAVSCGGQLDPFADLAFRFQVLPYVPLLAVCWPGDDDFPSSYKILFDAHVNHYLPTDGCAILGNMLTRRLLL